MSEQERLHELFEYRDGELLRKTTAGGHHIGTAVGGSNGRYLQTRVDGRLTTVHRIIWMMHYGDIPPGREVDHINNVTTDNRLENLRLCSHRQNAYNQKLSKSSTTGVKGVHWKVANEKWTGQLRVNGLARSRLFNSKACAGTWVKIQRHIYHGEHANDG